MPVSEGPVIVWLRQDLRLADHPALSAASRGGRPVIPLYVLDDATPGQWRRGGASRWWLGTSLPRLAASLEKLGSRLVVREGPALDAVASVAREVGASAVYFTRCYEPWSPALEGALKETLGGDGLDVRRFGGSLIVEPDAVRTGAGGPYKVYSPFARAVMALPEPRAPLPAPESLIAPTVWPPSAPIADLGLLPTKPDWAGDMREAWQPGEAGAAARLGAFVDGPIARYKDLRDRPDVVGTSRLSPHLHFGEVSPLTCWHAARTADVSGKAGEASMLKFLKELLWREFSYHLLHHFPTLPSEPFRPEFSAFPWHDEPAAFAAWKKGRTGYPIVDAGLRELWATGYMHNRVRMIAASFLVKDLLVPWQQGEAWFWDTLVDADLANNAASWQWVAGCGADAAPYFRIFNPVKQGQTFDPDGAYVRRWVPEIAALPADAIHAPWEAPPGVLAAAGVRLGDTYPHPIVDHRMARDRALEAFAAIKRD
jgi:deoxyribodipyrimidine photo-lyase